MAKNNEMIKAMFTDSAEEEVEKLIDDVQLAQAFEELKSSNISPELKRRMLGIVATFADLFSASLPEINEDIDIALETASRDINLSRLLRERGLFRIYRIIKLTDTSGTPIYHGMINPTSGEPFSKMEDLIGYFCEASHVSRSLVFSRLKTIDNCVGLGMDLEHAFKTIVSKPYAVTETLRMLGDWENGELVNISPDTAQKLLTKFGKVDEKEIKFDALDDVTQKAIENYSEEDVKNAIVALLDEVAGHERVKDVLDFVRHDVLSKPEISYRWDEEDDSIIIEYVKKELVDGKEFIAQILSIPFYPDLQGRLPKEVRDDLIRRLPFVNKQNL